MYCNSCETQNPDNVKFCSNCGGALQTAPSQAAPVQPTQPVVAPQPSKNGNGKTIGIIAGIVAVVVVAIIVVVVALGSGKDNSGTNAGTNDNNVQQNVDANSQSTNDAEKEEQKVTKSDFLGSSVELTYPDGTKVETPRSINLTVNGKEITLPCKLSDFLEITGLTLPEDAPTTLNYLNSGEISYEFIELDTEEYFLSITVENYSDTEINIEDAIIECIEFEDKIDFLTEEYYSTRIVALAGELTCGSSYEDFVAVFSEFGEYIEDEYGYCDKVYEEDDKLGMEFEFKDNKCTRIEVDIDGLNIS